MRALLDTSSFLWYISGSDKLSSPAKNFISDLNNQIILSSVSLWEIAIKISLGKLELLQPFNQIIPHQLEENDISILPIELRHLDALINMPFHHRDPFDRLIIAQSIVEEIAIISPDQNFFKYPVNLIW